MPAKGQIVQMVEHVHLNFDGCVLLDGKPDKASDRVDEATLA